MAKSLRLRQPISDIPSEFKRFAGISLVVFISFLTSVYLLRHNVFNLDHGQQGSGTIVQVKLLVNHQDARTATVATAPGTIQQETADAAPGQNTDAAEEAADEALPAPAPSKIDAKHTRPPSLRTSLGASASAFRDDLQHHIAQFKRYPDAARKEQLSGVVELLFEMRRDGYLSGLWVTTSSGHAILDNAALETLRRAEPLPPIPAGFGDRLVIKLPVKLFPR